MVEECGMLLYNIYNPQKRMLGVNYNSWRDLNEPREIQTKRNSNKQFRKRRILDFLYVDIFEY